MDIQVCNVVCGKSSTDDDEGRRNNIADNEIRAGEKEILMKWCVDCTN